MASNLEELIGVPFHDVTLLQSAFVHRSFLHEHPERIPGLTSNERLEFLGDAVLNFITAAWLYERFPSFTEGELTALRAALVKASTLAGFARSLNLGQHVRISRGEDTPAARNRTALLADVFEAVLGAIYLDQGLEAVRDFLMPFLERQLEVALSGRDVDHRTRLQEVAQARFGQTPRYRTVRVAGPDHEREFTLAALLGEHVLGEGSGPSKQAAAQAAARAALERLESGWTPLSAQTS
ncbi:MAG: ribonuclease III [Oscillochloridaceae bacterium]|nr:ribonuclease III [Chloroflexaceae bacterium]MDW8391667.1 ribonuclease III [Oscillochloridaceae bacterium]